MAKRGEVLSPMLSARCDGPQCWLASNMRPARSTIFDGKTGPNILVYLDAQYSCALIDGKAIMMCCPKTFFNEGHREKLAVELGVLRQIHDYVSPFAISANANRVSIYSRSLQGRKTTGTMVAPRYRRSIDDGYFELGSLFSIDRGPATLLPPHDWHDRTTMRHDGQL